jgi:predicted nucleic acid-binding Zn ribbon protein
MSDTSQDSHRRFDAAPGRADGGPEGVPDGGSGSNDPEAGRGRSPRVPADFARLGDLLGGVFPREAGEGEPPSEVQSFRPSPPKPRALGRARTENPRSTSGRRLPRRPAKSGVERDMADAWQEVVGTEIAANTQPLQLRQGRLVVAVSSSVWAQTLQLMSGQIQDRLNRSLGEDTVRLIVFRHAGWETTALVRSEPQETTKATSAPAYTPTEEQVAALEAVASICTEERLREQILRAMKASFAADGEH